MGVRTPRHGDELGLLAWICVALAGVAVAGLIVLPSAGFVWLVVMIFAVSAVPQALLRRARRDTGAPDQEEHAAADQPERD